MGWPRCRPPVCGGRGRVFPRLQSGLPNIWLPPYPPARGVTRSQVVRGLQFIPALHLPAPPRRLNACPPIPMEVT